MLKESKNLQCFQDDVKNEKLLTDDKRHYSKKKKYMFTIRTLVLTPRSKNKKSLNFCLNFTI